MKLLMSAENHIRRVKTTISNEQLNHAKNLKDFEKHTFEKISHLLSKEVNRKMVTTSKEVEDLQALELTSEVAILSVEEYNSMKREIDELRRRDVANSWNTGYDGGMYERGRQGIYG